MQRIAVHLINATGLGLLFLAAPAIAGVDFGNWRITSHRDTTHLLMMGLGLGILANLLFPLFLKRRRSHLRQTTQHWAIIHALILGITWGCDLGYIRFDWMEKALT